MNRIKLGGKSLLLNEESRQYLYQLDSWWFNVAGECCTQQTDVGGCSRAWAVKTLDVSCGMALGLFESFNVARF